MNQVYVIVDPNGQHILETIRVKANDSIIEFMGSEEATLYWDLYAKKGYKCLKVAVTFNKL